MGEGGAGSGVGRSSAFIRHTSAHSPVGLLAPATLSQVQQLCPFGQPSVALHCRAGSSGLPIRVVAMQLLTLCEQHSPAQMYWQLGLHSAWVQVVAPPI